MSIKSILGERIIKKLWPILSSFINEVTGESIVALISFRLEPSYPLPRDKKNKKSQIARKVPRIFRRVSRFSGSKRRNRDKKTLYEVTERSEIIYDLSKSFCFAKTFAWISVLYKKEIICLSASGLVN